MKADGFEGLWLGLPDETIDALTLGFAIAVIATVFAGRKLARPIQPGKTS